jgi:hypothetical protein
LKKRFRSGSCLSAAAAHELVDQCRRMLPIAVHEQDGAQAGVVEAGEQRRLLAEIAGQ